MIDEELDAYLDSRIRTILAGGDPVEEVNVGGVAEPVVAGAGTVAAEVVADSLTAGGVLKPPQHFFADPKLGRATPLVVTEEGRVFGHLATWRQCHMGVGNKCVMAPRSATGYAHFKTGSVLTDNGDTVRVGKITLGTGHADKAYGVIPAVEHYDHTGSVVAVVNTGEDAFGVWVAGALVADVEPNRVAELRRSPLSGDWRRVNGNLELVAALAVNSPGFPVLHDDGDGAYSLVAAGMLTEQAEADGAVQPGGLDFAEVDAFLTELSRVERAAMVSRAFQDVLPPQEGCGCDV
jgi:hypothetical protein